MAPVSASVAGAGGALSAMREGCNVGGERVVRRRTPVHPYLARQMSDSGFRQTLEVRTLGCARRSLPYRSTSNLLA